MTVMIEIKFETSKKHKSSYAQFYRNVSLNQLEELKQQTLEKYNNWKKKNVEYIKEEIICKVYDN